ncbi:MAG: tetratricopeptide repeat protein [Bacteroidota bacterium]|nr:tetratricopeptide repeat protein [Bacteroidota bacterium]
MKNLCVAAFLCSISNLLFSQNSDSAQYYFQKGLANTDARLYAVAGENFDKAIQFNPNFAEAYLANGKVNLEMSKIYEAGQNFTKAYQLQPGNAEVIKQLASFSFNNRQYQKAIDLVQKCDNCADADRVLGMSYYHIEDYGKAETYLKKAIKENDNDAESAFTLGRTYLELENEQNAIPQYQKAITLDPERSTWIYELALIYYNQNDYKNALKYFDMAIEKGYTKTNDFYENYGFTQLYMGDTENGLKTLTLLLERKPNNKELLTDIAYAMYTTKQYKEALDYYGKLLSINSNDASSLFMAGMTFQKMGQKDKGQKICDKAIQMDPSLARNRQKKEMPMGM